MGKKRFKLNKQFLIEREITDYIMIPILDRDEGLSVTDAVDLLNELHEENMCLKGEVAHYKLILMSLEKEAKRISENWKVRK